MVESVSDSMENTMKVRIGSTTFKAKLHNNASAAKLKEMLPLTLEMRELNGNEKYVEFPAELPTNTAKPVTIQNGDIMHWGANTLVLFYKTFETTCSYTRLGRLEEPSGLASAVGKGTITVTFELE